MLFGASSTSTPYAVKGNPNNPAVLPFCISPAAHGLLPRKRPCWPQRLDTPGRVGVRGHKATNTGGASHGMEARMSLELCLGFRTFEETGSPGRRPSFPSTRHSAREHLPRFHASNIFVLELLSGHEPCRRAAVSDRSNAREPARPAAGEDARAPRGRSTEMASGLAPMLRGP
jgi:hypothetical protein